jgi:PKD repeat protein
MRKATTMIVVYFLMIISSIHLITLVDAAATVVLSPTEDTMIKNDSPYTMYWNSWSMGVRNAYGENTQYYYEIDSLIKFDLFSIPSSATILSASIHLYYFNWTGSDPAGRTLTLYLITSNWKEDNVYWTTQPLYAATPTDTAIIPASINTWMTWDVTADVQALIHERAFYGWKIADETTWAKPNVPMTHFRTKENGNYIPYLEITYTVSEEKKTSLSSFSFSPPTPTTKDTVQFTDASYTSKGTMTAWFWNFGDGNSSTEQNPTHNYTQSGQYLVTLQVTTSEGMTDTMTTSLVVSQSKSTPGFELLIVLCALAVVLLGMFCVKKRK